MRKNMSEEESYEDSEYSSLPESYMDSQEEGNRFSVAFSILTPKEPEISVTRKSPPPEDLFKQLHRGLLDKNSLLLAADPATTRR